MKNMLNSFIRRDASIIHNENIVWGNVNVFAEYNTFIELKDLLGLNEL